MDAGSELIAQTDIEAALRTDVNALTQTADVTFIGQVFHRTGQGQLRAYLILSIQAQGGVGINLAAPDTAQTISTGTADFFAVITAGVCVEMARQKSSASTQPHYLWCNSGLCKNTFKMTMYVTIFFL